MTTNLTQRALEFATDAHSGQTRKFDGVPYITHPIAVAQIAKNIAQSKGLSDADQEIIEIIALLHDTVEDTYVRFPDIRRLFEDQSVEFVERIISGVDVLTKRVGENYLDSIKRIMLNKDAVIVKLADLSHNSSDLNQGSLKDKYRLATFILENF